MRATVQSGGQSPKPMSSPTSTSQLKSVSDSVQNSASFSSHNKGRKRERVDQGSEPVKRERSVKVEDGDSGNFTHDNILKTEISKITENGGLVDGEGVEKLVQLMVPDKTEKQIDLACRSLLAAVIAATDKFDCLCRFVQMRGLPVFDEWLQEVHKGKIGDGIGSREGDKSVEEFLLVLLRALYKLPVNLQALQMCNIGKSVNHLRTHKNTEIQKKARGLVDTWKKRVEAEIYTNDMKSKSAPTAPWPAKLRLPDVGQGGNRHSGASSDVAMKSSVTQHSASKTASVKIVQGENTTGSASTSAFPGLAKSVLSPASATTNLKDGQTCVASMSGGSDHLMTNARDEKSSSCSPSHNNSQSCSSDHTKTGGLSGKEDARSSTAMSANKLSGGSSRHRKPTNGFSGSTPSGGKRESGSCRNSSLHKIYTSEKISQSGLMEKALDETSIEGNTPKLIVKISNHGRGPAQRASVSSFNDPAIMNSRASSPVLSEKHDQSDHSLKEKSDSQQAIIGSDIHTESWQSNDFKDLLTASDEGDGSPTAVTDEERCRTGDDCKKALEVSKTASSSSGNENKAGNLQDASYSSINALIEGVKYSEADDTGMNLLASVAAGQILKSELTAAGSPERNTATVDMSCMANAVVKSSDENLVRDECQSKNGLGTEKQNQGSISGDSRMNNDNADFCASGGKAANGLHQHVNTNSMDLQQVTESNLEIKGKLNKNPISTKLGGLPESTVQETRDGDSSEKMQEDSVRGVNTSEIPDVKVSGGVGVKVETIEKLSCTSVEVDVKGDKCTVEGPSGGGQTAQKPPAVVMQSDSARGTKENALGSCGVDRVPEDHNVREYEKTDMAPETHTSQSKKQINEGESDTLMRPENRGLCSSATGFDAEHVEENSEMKEVHDQDVTQMLHNASSSDCSHEMDKHLDSKPSKLIAMQAEEAEECTSTTADASSMSAAAISDADAKVEFDLNEGFNADDGKCYAFNSITTSGCAPAVQLISPVPFPASSVSCGIPTSVTMTAAAKGPFVPPGDLLRSKGELGWKGSAATSAFRPAEPRKVTEMALGTLTTAISDGADGRQSRPPLDIDLNVPDETILDDVSSQNCARHTDAVSLAASGHDPVGNKTASTVHCPGGLDLDLNQVDEAFDVGYFSTSSGHKIDIGAPFMQVKSSLGGPPNREMSVHRDFDLNNGPSVDEVTAEPSLLSQHARSSFPSQPHVSGLRMSTAEPGNFSSWLSPSGNTYSAVTISSIMPDRGDQPFAIVAPNGSQRLLTPASGSNPFGPAVYRGQVFSSPAVSYPSAPFEYTVFPFNSSFPLPSASFSTGSTAYAHSTSSSRLCFPAVNPQLVGPASTVSSHFPRPYVVGLPDGSNSGIAETSWKWARQGLDLNAGPGGSDMEGRDESLPLLSRQLPVASSHTLAEEHARFQLADSVCKRKESDGGWDGYKRPSWQ